MATRLYKISVGEGEFAVAEGAGSAVVSDTVEVTVELADTAVNEGATTRSVKKEEVLAALDKIKNHILKGNWLPA